MCSIRNFSSQTNYSLLIINYIIYALLFYIHWYNLEILLKEKGGNKSNKWLKR